MTVNFLRLTVFIALVINGMSLTKGQNTFTPDFSMSFNEFQKQATQPKDEIWVVDFWASWCRPCIELVPEMKVLYNKFKDKKVRFVSVSWDENGDDWKAAIEYLKIEWPQVKIPKPNMPQPFIDKNFPHKKMPTLFIVKPDGSVKKTDEGMLEATLEKLLEKMEKN